MDGNISENCSLLEESMMQELQNLRRLSSTGSIPKVPEGLRHIKQTIHTPKVVSIGPYHHGRKELKAMEEYKKRCLDDFINMTNQCLGSYIQVVRIKERQLRAYYDGSIKLRSDEFVKIVLVDAVFIIVFLLRLNYKGFVDEEDRVFGTTLISQDVQFDMLLLENQLPFFILVDLFDFGRTCLVDDYCKIDMFDLSYHFFKELMHLEFRQDTWEGMRCSDIHHFVDFLIVLHSPFDGQTKGKLQRTSQSINLSLLVRKEPKVEPRTVTVPSITELHKAGVRFKVTGSTYLFDLQFNKGILEFPKLVIGRESEISTRNMLVFEKCCLPSNYINDSVVLMDNLIKTQKDVDLLVKFGILENRLGDSGKVLLLIKELADGTFLDWDGFSFASLCEDLNAYYGCSGSRWRARCYDWKENLIETYFKTPWSGISVIAGIVVLTFTVVQAVYAIVSFRSSR